MSDLERRPGQSWWHPDVSTSGLKQMLEANKGRLVSLSVRDTNPIRMAALWIRESKDDRDGGWNDDLDADAITSTLDEKSARLTCLAPFVRNGRLRFAAAWIPNTGDAEIRSGWKAKIDADDLAALLDDKKARLIVLRSYVTDGTRHRAAVWVDNTGEHAMNWWWNPRVDADGLGEMLKDNKGRLVCLDPFMDDGRLLFSAAWVENTKAHAKTWWWYHGFGAETIGQMLEQRCAYLAELQTYPVGDEIHLACAMYAHPLPDPTGATLIRVTATGRQLSQTDGMTSLGQDQRLSVTLKNLIDSPVRITGGTVHLNQSGGYLDGDDHLLGSDNLLNADTLELAPGAEQTFARDYDSGKGVANFIVNLRAESGTQAQDSHTVVPIAVSGFPAPPPLDVSGPLYVGLWANPAEVFPLWRDDKVTMWISVAGHLVKMSPWTARLNTWHMTLEIDGKVVVDEDLPLELWTFPDAGGEPDVIVGADGAAYLQALTSFFAHGFPLEKVSKQFDGGQLRLFARYKIEERCGVAVYEAPVKRIVPVTIDPPFEALGANRFWKLGNGPDHDSHGAHEWPRDRYVYDIAVADQSDSTHAESDPASMRDNENFYCYGKAVLAVRSGHVVTAEDTNPENHGTTENPDINGTQNWVLVKHHDGSYAGYYHLRKGKNEVVDGDPVIKGQKLGEIGNAGGSSEPHLHFSYTIVDPGGRGTVAPMILSGLKTKSGKAVTAVPATGYYKL